jgi:hypothetical protein
VRSADVAFWIGLLLLFIPIAAVALHPTQPRSHRLFLVVLLGYSLYAVKVIGWPNGFAFFDEFIHLRNTQDILASGHVLTDNPLLPTAGYYPGLALAAAVLSQFTGVDPFVAGTAVIGLARGVFCAAFFLVAERVTRSDRAAAAAALVYATNPMFLFWSATFAYENLALPLAAFVVWWVGRSRRTTGLARLGVASLVVAAVAMTHHVASMALAALLVLWTLGELFWARRARDQAKPNGLLYLGGVAVWAVVASLGWLTIIAGPAGDYLFGNNIIPALQDTIAVVLGERPGRALYESGGLVAPWWEKGAGFLAVVLLLLALAPALFVGWHWRRRVPVVIGGVVALIYPVTLAARLSPTGVAISGRSSEYVYTGLACVIALLISAPALASHGSRLASWWRRRVESVRWTWLLVGWLTAVFVGNTTIGTAFYQRLPEAVDAKGYPWTIQQDVVAAAHWARAHLGPGQVFAANALDASVLATYGDQDPISQLASWPIFFAPAVDADVVESMRAAGVRYLLLNWRMADGLPATPGYYFSPAEPGSGTYQDVFPRVGLDKFVENPCITVVYAAGKVAIVDVSGLFHAPCAQV